MKVYLTGHIHSETVGRAFAQGARAQAVGMPMRLMAGPSAFYGILRGCGPLIHQAIAEGREWYFIDNGYFGASHYDGYYRVTRNAYQHTGVGKPDWQRWDDLGIEVRPWRKRGEFIVVCPPGEAYCAHHRMDPTGWLANTLRVIDEHSKRPVLVRVKGAKVPLADDLEHAHALVTHASNAAVKALLQGVPVFCTGTCAAAVMGLSDLRQVDAPRRPEGREAWAAVLAGQQWTLDEFERGIAWNSLTNTA